MDIVSHNRAAWDRKVASGDAWTVPVSTEAVAKAKMGIWDVVLTPRRVVPKSWFPALRQREVLALASGGGQQGPILAAAGANVTVFDNSNAQLDQDRMVGMRDGLDIKTVQGDMADLSCFDDGSFDLIVNPCSNVFVPDVSRVWREAYRVLRKSGSCLSGFINPILFALDTELEARGIAQITHKIPYSDTQNLDQATLADHLRLSRTLKFGHSLEDQIGRQLDAGFIIAGLYEDHGDEKTSPIHRYVSCYIATRAIKV